MRIAIATPLYPPDIAEPAPYVKELARRLSPTDEVTIITYGRIPESIPGVQIYAVDKQQPLPLRLIRYALTLWRVALDADVLYAQNGASVELPLSFVSFFVRMPIVLHIGDAAAHERTKENPRLRAIEKTASARARAVITDIPPQKPEILPFSPSPTEATTAYEAAWLTHMQELRSTFARVTRS